MCYDLLLKLPILSPVTPNQFILHTKLLKLQIKNIGNDTISGKTGSVFLYINELNHDRFKRSSDGKDLLFIHKLSLYDALGCKKNRIIYIKMLDLKIIGIYISDKTIIKSRHIKKIKNQGMPIVKQLEKLE